MIGKFANTVKDQIDDLFADCVMSSGIIVSGVLFASDQLFRVEKLAVCSSAHLVCLNIESKTSKLILRKLKY